MKKKKDKQSLEERIRDVYEDLPSSERVVSDLIIEFPGDIAIFSATDLAKRAKSSNAAVTRLIKRLGYADYKDAQQQVRDAQSAGEPIYLNSSMVAPKKHDDNLKAHITQDIKNLQDTFDSINIASLNQAIQAVTKAHRVKVIGFRNSYFFASYIRRQLIQVREDVELIPAPGQIVMEDLGGITSKDVVIIVGMRRRVPVLKKIMEALYKRDVPIIYFTDRRAVSTTRYATWNFPTHARGISLFDSYVGLISLLNFFCTEVIAQLGAKGRSKLKSIETLMEDAQEIEKNN